MWRSIKFCTNVCLCLAAAERSTNLCACLSSLVTPSFTPLLRRSCFFSPAIVYFPAFSLQWMRSANLAGQMIRRVCQGRLSEGGRLIVDSAATNVALVLPLFGAKLTAEPSYAGPTWDLLPSPCDWQRQIYQANNGPNFCTMCFRSVFCLQQTPDCLADFKPSPHRSLLCQLRSSNRGSRLVHQRCSF